MDHNITSPKMEDFPDSVLSQIASYIPGNANVLLAVALSAPSESWERRGWKESPSRASKAVLPEIYDSSFTPTSDLSEWDELYLEWLDNFVLVDRPRRVFTSLASKLNDGDLSGILVCVDAKNRLTRLILPQCLNITGSGLAPLRNCSALEKIDLSLHCDHSNPVHDPAPKLSEDVVLAVLHTIIGQEKCPLRHLILPKIWKKNKSDKLGIFLQKYSSVLNGLKVKCTECKAVCQGADQSPWFIPHGEKYGVQNMTCNGYAEHTEHFCNGCEVKSLHYCPGCELKYCDQCRYMETCSYCGVIKCDWCLAFSGQCKLCDRVICSSCSTDLIKRCLCCKRELCLECTTLVQCQSCGNEDKSRCITCIQEGKCNVKLCKHCNGSFCHECRPMEYCFQLSGDICLSCHDLLHGGNTIDCYWKPLPSELQQMCRNL